jgi:hypothetical protein
VKTNNPQKKARAPGAGRKPRGDYRGKAATFTTRIQPELRAALDKAARESNRSLSQEVERRLDESFKIAAKIARDFGPPHIAAFSHLVSEVGRMAELMTGKRWREDRFTFEAFKSAVNILLDRLAYDGDLQLPERCALSANETDRHSPGFGEQMRRPDGVGAAIALGLWSQIEMSDTPPPRKGVHLANQFYALPKVRRDLGLKSNKEQSR